jgi:cytochrome bd-type quinol oxidase subunit 2
MNAAHIHLLLNHVPILGSIFGLLLLLYAMLKKSDEIKKVCYGVFVITALITIPVYLTGDGAARIVNDLPGVSKDIIRQHDDAATKTLFAVELLGVASLLGWWLTHKGKRLAGWLSVIVLVLALLSTGLSVWTGGLGGQIRHTEIRAQP